MARRYRIDGGRVKGKWVYWALSAHPDQTGNSPLLQLLFLAFLLVPLLEIYLLIQVGSEIGALATVLLVVFTAVLGAVLLRLQGLITLNRVRSALARGELPTQAMLEGVVLLFSGALLLTPGFFTDAIGFLALIPALRRAAIAAIIRRGVMAAAPGGGPRGETQRGPQTLEGEYRREDED